MILVAIFLLFYVDGSYDADAFVIPSGKYVDCMEFGRKKAEDFVNINPGAIVNVTCEFRTDPFKSSK